MIKVYDKTPKIYSNLSRDFQLLGHIYDAIFNSVKTNIDMIAHNPLSKNSDIKLLDLLAKTLNFESKHNYNAEDLYALCTAFKTIIKKKGTKSAVEDCINLLLKAQDISKNAYVSINKDVSAIEIWVPYELKDIILLEDMLDYILPAGYNYHLYQANLIDNAAREEFKMLDTVTIVKRNPIKEYNRDDVPKEYISDIFQSTIINENDVNNLNKEEIQDE